MKPHALHIFAPLCALFPALGLAGEVSLDGRWLARAGAGAFTVTDVASGTEAHRRALTGADGTAARSAAILAHDDPAAFLVAPQGVAEVWLVALDADAGPFHQGFVHSYVAGMEESLVSESGRFARQRIELTAPVRALARDPQKRFTVQGLRADGQCVRIHLVARREIGPCPAQPGSQEGANAE